MVSRFQRQSVSHVVYGHDRGKGGEDDQIASPAQSDLSPGRIGMESAAQDLGQVAEGHVRAATDSPGGHGNGGFRLSRAGGGTRW